MTKIYTNCDWFHCSVLRPDTKEELKTKEIASHLSVTLKPKYTKISPNVSICDLCVMLSECDRNPVYPIRVEDNLNVEVCFASHTIEERIAWHKKKIDEAKARIEYHEAELRRITS